MDSFPIQHAYLIPLLPLIGAAIAGFCGAKWLKGLSHLPIWAGVGCSAILSLWILFTMVGLTPAHHSHDEAAAEHHEVASAEHGEHAGEPGGLGNLAVSVKWFDWISVGKFNAEAGTLIDPLTAVMLSVVTGIGFLITVFAAGYMKGEEGYFRFFAYLGLFIFSMTCLVMGNNLIMLYLGWEGVGLCSYLLIGYYYDKPAAREAAKKAFLVNRIGDFGFGLGIMWTFLAFGTVTYFTADGQGLLQLAAADPSNPALLGIPFLLMLGAFGKSAQFPLYVWLPDAMEGPTPVSALIHAATMVTAGIYMIARCGALFVANESAMLTVAAVGTFTAIFAGTIAMRQFDLKKVFAYSTVSQLGFMFAAVGCFAPVAGVFHLITHAFFKALLFLSSGVVMHAMAGELDMRKFSGLKRVLPKTRWLMLIGCLALAGFPLTSGFFSKDEIIAASWEQQKFIAVVLLFTAFLTAYYTFRLYFRVFEGPEVLPEPSGDHGHGHAHPTHSADPNTASHSAIMAGDAEESGVDEHLADTSHQAHSTDHGHGHGDRGHHNHEPFIMMFPLVVLAIGALLAGGLAFNHSLSNFLGHSPSLQLSYGMVKSVYAGQHIDPAFSGQLNEPVTSEDASHATSVHYLMMTLSIIASLSGIYLAYTLHLKNRMRADKLAEQYVGIAKILDHKYWVDEIYQAFIIEPLRKLGKILFAVDRFIIDGAVNVLGFVPPASGFVLKLTTQRGYLQGYAVTMLFGVAIILLVIFL